MKLRTCYGFRWMESATVKVGPFARGGKSRVLTKAADRDFKSVASVTPWRFSNPPPMSSICIE